MLEDTKYNPNIAIHPGATLKDTLDELGMSQSDLATRTGLTPKTINEIIQGKNPITPETAIKLSSVFGMSATFWNNLERNYQETIVRLDREEKLKSELPTLKNYVCYKELAKWKYVPPSKRPEEKISNLLNFFGVSSLQFVKDTHQVAFRQSKQEQLSKESLAAWLRCGELEAAKISTSLFDREKLISSIEVLRKLTRIRTGELQEKLQKICADFGVAIAFVPYFGKTYVDGATRWINSDKALIQVSLRGAWSDNFWFTFFHEIGHLLRHGKKEAFVEFENKDNRELQEKEKEADEFATETLIPSEAFKTFLATRDFSDRAIKAFADEISVTAGIVAGRLGHELAERGSINGWKRFAHLRTRIKFAE